MRMKNKKKQEIEIPQLDHEKIFELASKDCPFYELLSDKAKKSVANNTKKMCKLINKNLISAFKEKIGHQ